MIKTTQLKQILDLLEVMKEKEKKLSQALEQTVLPDTYTYTLNLWRLEIYQFLKILLPEVTEELEYYLFEVPTLKEANVQYKDKNWEIKQVTLIDWDIVLFFSYLEDLGLVINDYSENV